MNRSITGGLLLAGSLLLALPSPVSARCYGSGATFRCDPIISDSLRRQSQGLPPRYAPKSSNRYRYEGNTYSTPSGLSIHRYKYKSPTGRTYKGKIETFPSGTVRHRGSWK